MVKCALCNDEEGKFAILGAYPVGEKCALDSKVIRKRVWQLGCGVRELLEEYQRLNPSLYEDFLELNRSFRGYILYP